MVTAFSVSSSRSSQSPHSRARLTSLPPLVFLLLLFSLIDAAPIDAQAPGQFRHLADYTHIGLVLNSLVGPGPQPGTQRLYVSILGAHKFHLLEIDPDTGQVTVFDSPVDGEIAAWGMTADAEGNVFLGTAPNAHLMMFQAASNKIVDFGRAGPSEQWIWSLTVGSDNRVYGGTYPDCKLVRLDSLSGVIEDLGRIDPLQQYVRYVSAGKDGVIYIGIGDAPGDIASYSISSGEIHDLLAPSLRATGFASVYQGTDGLSYGLLSPNAFQLSPTGATPIPWSHQAPAVSTMTLADGRMLSLDEENGILVLTEKSQSGSAIVLRLAYSGESSTLFRIGLGPDGLVYGSATMPSDLVQIDPVTGIQRYIGTLGPGEAYSMMSYSSQLLLGTYSDDPSTLALYDPGQPFSTSPGSSNPTFIPIPDNNDSWRPFAMAAASDGTVYVGVEAGYGYPTGPLLIWNPASGSTTQFNVIPNQSVVSLAISDDLLVGGTSTQTGLGINPVGDSAELFVWNRTSNQAGDPIAPVQNAPSITDLVAEQNGLVFGIAADTIFEFDPHSNVIRQSQPFPFGAPVYNSAVIDKVNRLWGLSSDGVFVVDPASLHAELIAPAPAPITGGFVFADDQIYFIAGPSVYSYKLLGTLSAAVDLSASENSVAYGSPMSLNVSVRGLESCVPTGSIRITDDGQTLTTAPLIDGLAQINLPNVALGTHLLTAVYSGDSYYTGASSGQLTATVRFAAPLITVPSAYSMAQGAVLTLLSTVSTPQLGTPSPTGAVQFYDGGVPLGTAAPVINGTARFSTAALAGGYHNIGATYSGDANFAPASSAVFTESVQGIALASAVTVVDIPTTGSVGIQIGMTPEGGLAGPVSFNCSGNPAKVSCTFSPSILLAKGYAELVLTNSGSPGSARNTGPSTGLSSVCCGLLAFSFIVKPRKVVRTALLTVAMLGTLGCGTSYVPAESATFRLRVTATQQCGAATNTCLSVSSGIDIDAIMNEPGR
ncbi:MAG: Ig-like domain-containing protein [Acidobacteriaceae bacterium]